MKYVSILVFVCCLLSACSGSSSSNKTIQIDGAGVKGPLANAIVNVYEVDYAQADLKGRLIDEGETGSNAAIMDLAIPLGRTGFVMLEFVVDEDTVEINTGSAPVFDRLVTVVDIQRIYDGESIYASPLTLLAVEMAIENADKTAPFSGNEDGLITELEFSAALEVARLLVTESLGFGMPASVDIFSVPPLITESTITLTSQAEVASYRQAIEAVAALTVLLSEDTSEEDSPSELLKALAEDLSDGDIDGEGKDGPVTAYDSLAEEVDTQISELDIATLEVPGTTDLVSEIEAILVAEQAASGVTTDTTGLADGSIEVELDEPELVPDISGSDDESSLDSDADGIRDELDADDDNDGVNDSDDHFPLDDSESKDTDGDGIGDNADPEPYPAISFEQTVELFVAIAEDKQNLALATPVQTFIYESSDEAIATVDAQGYVTGVDSGSTTISAYIAGTPPDLTSHSYTVNVYEPCASCNTYQRIFDEAELDAATGMVQLDDGKVLMLSQLSSKQNNGGQALLSRLNADGSLDTSFGTSGHVVHTFTGLSRFSVRALALQSTGKILVLGESGVDRTTVVTRFNEDGSLDATFGSAGKYEYNDGIYWQSWDLELGASDEIMISLRDTSPDVAAVFRLTPDGVLDTSLASDGIMQVNDFAISALKILDDGKFIVAGQRSGDIILMRFETDGTLDESFGTAGEVVKDISGSADRASELLLLADGDILLVGRVATSGTVETVMMRLSSAGVERSEFGSEGLVTFTFNALDSIPYAVLEQNDGKIIVVGTSGQGDTDMAFARFNADGSLDSSITAVNSSSDGLVTYDLDYESSFNGALSILRRANGGYLLLNLVYSEQKYYTFYAFGDSYLVGLDENGALDNSAFIATGLANEVISDNDNDGIRDRLDQDDDQDGEFDDNDIYPLDTDNDGIDNALDPDDDGDGINDSEDDYPFDLDNDGYQNFIDPDDDGDTVWDEDDAFPYDPLEQYDTDGDGVGNNADPTPYPELTFDLNGDQAIGLSDTLDNPAAPSSGFHSIQYLSSDTDVATVNEFGTVTAEGLGTATISVDLTDWPDTPVSYQITVNNSCDLCVSSNVAIDVQDVDYTSGVIELADGDLLVFGYTESAFFSAAVARLNFDGTLDNGFNSGAPFEFNYAASKDTKVIDAVEQSDGKLLLLSEYNPSFGVSDLLVTRLNADGSIDTSYGSSGHFLLHDSSGSIVPGAMALKSDGKLIVVATFKPGGLSESVVIRLTETGALDTDFGDFNSGVSASLGEGELYDVALDGDKIVASGANTDGSESLLIRLTNVGEFDTTFNSTGSVAISFAMQQSKASDVLVQSTGQYLISGSLEDGEVYISRYNLDGSLDTSFGTSGVAQEGVSSAPFSNLNEAGGLLEQSDGTLVIVGGAELNSSGLLDTLVVWRFDGDGAVASVVTKGFGLMSPYMKGVDLISSASGGIIVSVDNYDSFYGTGDMILFGLNNDGSENNARFK